MRPSPALATFFWTVALAALPPLARAAEEPDLEFYMGSFATVDAYDEAVPTPEEVLGWQVGTWHVRHDQLVRYFEQLAAHSDRVAVERYGATHEDRPLLLVTITSPENHADLERIRSEHLAAVQAGEPPDPDRKAIAWLGYSVHGNEPSGSNAAPLVAYHLAASRDPEVLALLDDVVVLMDPSINPDGLDRFASWTNSRKSRHPVPERLSVEHREAWPGGRTNHYWFDLNRDWLLLTHPESQGRVARFHAWRPNLLTDHHEMGSDSTFFFQPGVPSRQNPRTPPRNLDLTREVARFHAEALDHEGELYYSEESFDDFYYGKGSTYPDVHGTIGILFEQASSRGQLMENAFGELSFPDTIRNQVLTSLSSLQATQALRQELLDFQAETVSSALDEAADDPVQGYVFGDALDLERARQMVDILLQHDIHVHELKRPVTSAGTTFRPGHAWIVPTRQPQYRLVKSLFETRTDFEDDTFYDVSTWVLPMSFGLAYGEVGRVPPSTFGPRVDHVERPTRQLGGGEVVAYALPWHDHRAPEVLARLQQAGLLAQVATRPLVAEAAGGQVPLDYGTVLVHLRSQPVDTLDVQRLMSAVVEETGLPVVSIKSGLTPEGIDLGSPSARALSLPRPLLVAGSGTSSYEVGQIWHQLDARWGLPVTLVDLDDLGGVDLSAYTHLLLPSGGYGRLDTDAIRAWVRDGGVVVGLRSGARWAGRELLGLEADDADDDGGDGAERSASYADYEQERAKTLVSGAIFETHVDRSHPLGYGMTRDVLPVFRRDTGLLVDDGDPFSDALVYTDDPLLSGYASDDNVQRIAGTPAATARRLGAGTVIRIADDPLFRGVWHGSSRLLANALFFGDVVKRTGPVDGAAGESGGDEQLEH